VEHSGSALHQPGSWLHWIPLPPYMGDAVAVSWLVIIALTAVAYLGTRRMQEVPSGLQNFLETVVEGLDRFTRSVIGSEGDKFTPFIATLFIYIFIMNAIGLIPGFVSPTATLNMTVALALTVFVSTHYHGVRRHGGLKYLLHLVGEPKWLAPLLFPMHLISELARPLALSVRLFGNIFGEDQLILQLAILSPVFLGFLPIPVHFFNMGFSLFVGLVQALVFSVLAAAYFAGAMAGEES